MPTSAALPAPKGPTKYVHHGVTCDRSGQSPIIGIRYSLRGQDYDLCEAEFLKLPNEDQAKYEAIETPLMSAAAAAAAAAASAARF